MKEWDYYYCRSFPHYLRLAPVRQSSGQFPHHQPVWGTKVQPGERSEVSAAKKGPRMQAFKKLRPKHRYSYQQIEVLLRTTLQFWGQFLFNSELHGEKSPFHSLQFFSQHRGILTSTLPKAEWVGQGQGFALHPSVIGILQRRLAGHLRASADQC